MVKKIKHLWLKPFPSGKNLPRSATIIGAPDDRGVFNVGGRPGAAHAPETVRKLLGEFMLGWQGEIGKVQFTQGFDVEPGNSIEQAHSGLRRAVSEALKNKTVPIILGGGHDFGFPHVAGVSDFFRAPKVGLINVDPHFDVRPVEKNGVITSGSPFFLSLESGVLLPKNFIEFGIQEHCNDQAFFNYIQKKKVKVIERPSATVKQFEKILQQLKVRGLKVVVSFDVDSVAMAYAPGVSAPQADGFTPQEFLTMASLCGENAAVVSVGFFELSPPLDLNQMTTRLVATAVHRFLCGLARR